MPKYLGIDSGGSGTTAWLADGRGRILARAHGGPGNPVKIGIEPAAKNILATARTALNRAGAQRETLGGVCAGVAGAGRPGIELPLLALIRRGLRARHFLLATDGAIALECALGESPGIVVVSGTGSIAYARSADGVVLRAGGWGSLFDDGGSGFQIGRSAVHAALAALDGRGPRTRLDRGICQALKLREIADVVEKPLSPDRVAALLPVVLSAARRGDAVASQLLDAAADELAALVSALMNRLGNPLRIRIFCTGGVFNASQRIRRRFAATVRHTTPGAQISLLRREPVEGALALAMRSGGEAQVCSSRKRADAGL